MRLAKIALLLPLLLSVTVAPEKRAPVFEPKGALAHAAILKLGERISVGAGVDIVGAWTLRGGFALFGNYSALVALPDGRLLAVGDRNSYLVFAPPGAARRPVFYGMPFPPDWSLRRQSYDAEAISVIHGAGVGKARYLVACEGTDQFSLFEANLRRFKQVRVPALRAWEQNQGPEAMRQLADGRVVTIAEMRARWFDRRRYPGLVFRGVPHGGEQPGRFVLVMPEGYRPTELAQLPDGRLLVLGRKFTPTGFHSVIVTADPAAVRSGAEVQTQEIARIDDPRVRENYEGMAITQERDGTPVIWLISDSNTTVWLQRTLLLKLRLRP